MSAAARKRRSVRGNVKMHLMLAGVLIKPSTFNLQPSTIMEMCAVKRTVPGRTGLGHNAVSCEYRFAFRDVIHILSCLTD